MPPNQPADYPALILTEDGDVVAGSEPDATQTSDPAGGSAPPSRPRVARRRPSDVAILPDVTDDERDVGWGEAAEPDDDERLLREVPPHHGS
jgi:hypothetical protein